MKIYVSLEREESIALRDLARLERRDARDQAALIIAQELKRRGLLAEPGGAERQGVTYEHK